MPDDLPARIRSERQRLGLSQREAAELLGMARGTYQQLEDSDRDIRVSTLRRLLKAGYRLEALDPELSERTGADPN